MSENTRTIGFADKFIRALLLRCPACWHGSMFRHPLAMNERCPDCDYKYDKGNGYFVGAMYSSYLLCLTLCAVTSGFLYLVGVPTLPIVVIVALQAAIVGPFIVFPYSRVFWVWAERDGALHDGGQDASELKRQFLERDQARAREQGLVVKPPVA
jgi:uncharacterized protein (DUF983 family)